VEKSLYTADYQTFLKLLYQLRIEKGLRQIDLAQLLDVHQSFVSKYESGERRLDIIEVKQICTCLGVNLVNFSERFETLLNDR
jgi:transcriptional regulator with XRE-family HTH domain